MFYVAHCNVAIILTQAYNLLVLHRQADILIVIADTRVLLNWYRSK